MVDVVIPFAARWRGRMLDGRKTVTSRTKRLGEPGGVFVAFGARFELLSVEARPYGEIAGTLYAPEGCDSEDEFRKAVRGIWWGKEPKDDREMYLHSFRRLDR